MALTNMPSDSELLAGALALAEAGFYVFPIAQAGKAPAIPKLRGSTEPAGLYQATRDPAMIRRWWGENNDPGMRSVRSVTGSNVGIRGGTYDPPGAEPGAHRLVIIDVDHHPEKGKFGHDDWAALIERHGPIPDTVEAISSSGGRHLYFWLPVDVSNGAAAGIPQPPFPHNSIDVRGDTGYVVAPPSWRYPEGFDVATSDLKTPMLRYEWEASSNPLDGATVARCPDWLERYLTVATEEIRAERRRKVDARNAKTQADVFGASVQDHPGLFMEQWKSLTDWDELLSATGAHFDSLGTAPDGSTFEYWTRPGKDGGVSASLDYMGGDTLNTFTSNWPGLAPEVAYDKVDYLVKVTCGGNDNEAKAIMRDRVAEYRRSTGQVATTSATTSATAPPADDGWDDPVVDVPQPWRREQVESVGDELAMLRRVRDAYGRYNLPDCAAPHRDGNPAVYSFAQRLVRLVPDHDQRPMVETIDRERMRDELRHAIDYGKVKTIKRGDVESFEWVNEKITPDLAGSVLAMRNAFNDYPLNSISMTPYLRPDRTICFTEGWDPKTQVYLHLPPDLKGLTVPEQPTVAQVAAAMTLLWEVYDEFPWVTSADSANYMAMLVTPFIRPALGPDSHVQGFVINAKASGTGKGLTSTVFNLLACGGEMGEINVPFGRQSDEIELEKKMTTEVVELKRVVMFDNVEGEVASAFLQKMLTSSKYVGRELGFSRRITADFVPMVLFNGNSIEFTQNDFRRRLTFINMDAHTADPTKRRVTFRHPDLPRYVRSNRRALVEAVLTLVRHWVVQGAKPGNVERFGLATFKEWGETVMGIFEACSGPEFPQTRWTDFLDNEDVKNEQVGTDRSATTEIIEAMERVWGSVVRDPRMHIAGSPPPEGADTFMSSELVSIYGDLGRSAGGLLDSSVKADMIDSMMADRRWQRAFDNDKFARNEVGKLLGKLVDRPVLSEGRNLVLRSSRGTGNKQSYWLEVDHQAGWADELAPGAAPTVSSAPAPAVELIDDDPLANF